MSSFKKTISSIKSLILSSQTPETLSSLNVDWNPLEWKAPKGKKLIIGTHSGRSGLRWLAMVFSKHDNIFELSEPFPLHESFYRYATWNSLPIDHSGFFGILQARFNKIWEKHDTIFYASPWLGFGMEEVDKYLKPNSYIYIIRNPEAVVNSLSSKGWYSKEVAKSNYNLASGIQPGLNNFHHQFSRISPSGTEFSYWNSMTAIGKSAWFWSQINNSLCRFFSSIDEKKVFKFKLEDIDQNYNAYLSYAKVFDLMPRISKDDFLSVKREIPNKGITNRSSESWSADEKKEFDENTVDFMQVFIDIETTIK